jgi:hypothetical protein
MCLSTCACHVLGIYYLEKQKFRKKKLKKMGRDKYRKKVKELG